MRVPLSWLVDYAPFEGDPEALAPSGFHAADARVSIYSSQLDAFCPIPRRGLGDDTMQPAADFDSG